MDKHKMFKEKTGGNANSCILPEYSQLDINFLIIISRIEYSQSLAMRLEDLEYWKNPDDNIPKTI